MTSCQREYDQSDRGAHGWSVAEPGSWTELAESTAFVLRGGGLALHPATIALSAITAIAASWALPLTVEQLLPWMGDQGVWDTLWAWFRLIWLVAVVCAGGTAIARTIAARPTRAEVWGAMAPMLVSCGLCVCTYIAALVGVMLATWLASVVGGWIGGPFGASLAVLIGFAALLGAVLATLLLLLAIPAIATNDADAPDAIQRAAAHLIARPSLSLVLIALCLLIAGLAAWATSGVIGLTSVLVSAGWEVSPALVWLPNTIILFVVIALGWAALTQTLLTLREVVDREDRASCWDPRPQAEATHQAIEARATISRGSPAPEPDPKS